MSFAKLLSLEAVNFEGWDARSILIRDGLEPQEPITNVGGGYPLCVWYEASDALSGNLTELFSYRNDYINKQRCSHASPVFFSGLFPSGI